MRWLAVDGGGGRWKIRRDKYEVDRPSKREREESEIRT
jgi:hypothetical protein